MFNVILLHLLSMAPTEVGTEGNIDPATEEILTSKLLVCFQVTCQHITFTTNKYNVSHIPVLLTD